MDEDDSNYELEGDYDALNDETFGDGEEYNWEAGHDIILKDQSRLKIQNVDNIEEESIKVLDENDYYFENDNDIEDSINRLVLDDYDDEEDEEAKLKLGKYANSSAFAYFMPPQVANKHLQWLAEKELPGVSPILGGPSVWAMDPPKQNNTTSTISTTIPKGFSYDNSSKNYTNDKIEPYSSVPLQQSSNLGLNDLISFNKVPQVTSNNLGNLSRPPPGLKPTFKTLNEVENELLSVLSAPKPEDKIISSPANTNAQRPKIMSLEELEREFMEAADNVQKEIGVQEKMQIPQMHENIPKRIINEHVREEDKNKSLPPQNMPPQNIQMPSHQKPPVVMMRHPGMPHIQHPHFPHNQQPPFPPQRNLHGPPNMHSLNQQQLKLLHQIELQQQHRIRVQGGFPPHPQLPLQHPLNSRVHPLNLNAKIPLKYRQRIDPHDGLMNDKDKQRLRNIQIIQLQNDHPHTTDYYFLMNRIKNSPYTDHTRNKLILNKLFPRKESLNTKNTYEPARFENSLGKLQAISALAPRKAIDTVLRVTDIGRGSSDTTSNRYLYLEIERLFECLLIIEEADIRLSVLGNGDEIEIMKRRAATNQALKMLSSKEKVEKFLNVNKGKLLISRLIPLMDPKVRYYVLGEHLIKNFRNWATGSKREMDKYYPYLRHCILSTNILTLLQIIEPLKEEDYNFLVSKRLGLTLVLCMLHQAEIMIAKVYSLGKSCEDFIHSWTIIAQLFVKGIFMQLKNLEVPIEIFPNVLFHFQRLGFSPAIIETMKITLRTWIERGSQHQLN